jgi:acetyl-CoA synthetase
MNAKHDESREPYTPAWVPTPDFINGTNLAWLMRRVGVTTYEDLHAWSVRNREAYWALAIDRLGIRFQRPYSRVANLSDGVEAARWLVDARFNIVESCFAAPSNSPAVIHQAEGGKLKVTSVAELEALTGLVAANLKRHGFEVGDPLAIIMPMTVESVSIYLGIIKAGCVVVSIADSFRPKEIATRLRLADAVAVFTQDVILRERKELPLYAKLVEAGAPPAIVLPAKNRLQVPLRAGDCDWRKFLQSQRPFGAVSREPEDHLNILFSSGTTGEPKAIPWIQTTPIKCATDAHFHQNVNAGDVLVWPTNIGWMMGPWLIFASLLNRATMGLYYGAPTNRAFGCFVRDAETTMLGVVPSMVKTWRNTGCMESLDWNSIKLFSSTGECSNADDMRWLMAQAGGKPVIEYCGGTEIGGGHITGTVTRPCLPGAFNTPALGLDFVILDDKGLPAEDGELFIIPPSIGLSTTLLKQDHHEVYFADTPNGPHGEVLRRHGDQTQKLPCGYWRGRGRADDTMNLGGIKISSAEIEHTLRTVKDVADAAAIAVASEEGPSRLVIYTVCSGARAWRKDVLAAAMQKALKRELNPLFKIHDIVIVPALPRTSSNKVLRRVLRDRYNQESRLKKQESMLR